MAARVVRSWIEVIGGEFLTLKGQRARRTQKRLRWVAVGVVRS